MVKLSGAYAFRIEPLGRQHDRDEFSCGVESLDCYLKTQASQDMRRKTNVVFVLIETKAPRAIAGYVTLCAIGVEQGAVPEHVRKHVPRYPLVSATLIGRLAISRNCRRKAIRALFWRDLCA